VPVAVGATLELDVLVEGRREEEVVGMEEEEDFLIEDVLVRRVVGLLLDVRADEVDVLKRTELLEESRTELDVLRWVDVLGFADDNDDDDDEEPETKRAPHTPELYEGVKTLPFM